LWEVFKVREQRVTVGPALEEHEAEPVVDVDGKAVLEALLSGRRARG
jgi:hypothetical protein